MAVLIADDCVELIEGQPRTGIDWRAAVVLQGPYEKGHTRIVIEEWHNRNPNILVVVSTYLPTDGAAAGLAFLSPYEKACIALGILVFIFVKTPSREKWPEFWRTNFSNQNLQRLTSYVGLRYVRQMGIAFAIKVRSDTFLGKLKVIEYMREEVVDKYPLIPCSGGETSLMKGRLVVTGNCTITTSGVLPNAPFHVRDHYYFGYTDDLLLFFDMTDSITWNNGAGIECIPPESAMTRVWMRRIGIADKFSQTGLSELLARYFIIEDPQVIEQARIKPKGPNDSWWSFNYSRYLRLGSEYIQQVYAKAGPSYLDTTRAQWEKLYANLVST